MIVALCTVITLVGLFFVLKKHFSIPVTITTLLLLFAGTNFFVMAVYSGAIQASILLALMVVVLWMTQLWHEKPRWIPAIILGLCMGLLIFIRAAGFATLFLFFFWGAYNKETFRMKWKIYVSAPLQLSMIVLLFSAGLILRLSFPQLFTGTYFCDYVEHKRAVYLIAPWLWQVLFSIRNGWIIYTPLVLFAIPGFYFLAENNKSQFYSAFLFTLVFLLLLASSPQMTTPDNYSQSRMTEIFAVLFIAIASFIRWIMDGRWLRRIFFFMVLAAVVAFNLFQIWQYRSGILNPWFTSPGYYKAIFLKTQVKSDIRSLQDFESIDMSSFLLNEHEFKITSLYFQEFDNSAGGLNRQIQSHIAYRGNGALRLDSNLRFTPDIVFSPSRLLKNYPLGFRFSAYVYSQKDFSENGTNINMTMRRSGILYRYATVNLKDLNLEKGKWNKVCMNYVIPREPGSSDQLIMNIWYTGDSHIYVDDLKAEMFELKDM